MNVAWIQNRKVEMKVVPIPEVTKGKALVKVILSGICGTDLQLLEGYYPFDGIPGHEFVGRVISLSKDDEQENKELLGSRVVAHINEYCDKCSLCLRGRRTHCLNRHVLGIKGAHGSHAEYILVPIKCLAIVPKSISDESACFVEPLAAAFAATEILNVNSDISAITNRKIALIGCGRLGMLIAFLLSKRGENLICIARRPHQVEILTSKGITVILEKDVDVSFENVFDVVFECSGSPEGFDSAVNVASPRGHIVLKSTFHGNTVQNLSIVVVKELTIIGSRCGDLKIALDILESREVDPSCLVSAVLPLSRVVTAFQRAKHDKSVMKLLLHCREKLLFQLSCRAPGKLILSGEHAVVYGASAVAASLDLYTKATLSAFSSSSDDSSLDIYLDEGPIALSIALGDISSLESAQNDSIRAISFVLTQLHTQIFLEEFVKNAEFPIRFSLTIYSDIPVGAGLGSSAAFCTAVAGLFTQLHFMESCTRDWASPSYLINGINALSFEAEKIFHGSPSGIDNTVSVFGGALIFKRGNETPLIQKLQHVPLIKVILVNTNVSRSSKLLVEKVRAFYESNQSHCDLIFKEIDSISSRIWEKLEFKSTDGIDELVRRNQILLDLIGVSHESIGAICLISEQYGCTAKLTGAGGGGCVYILPKEENCVQLADALNTLESVSILPECTLGQAKLETQCSKLFDQSTCIKNSCSPHSQGKLHAI